VYACRAVKYRIQARTGDPQVSVEPRTAQVVVPAGSRQETMMLKGGLLWLIGIPLPIILILFFMGWLS
jgi:hypothetical protein